MAGRKPIPTALHKLRGTINVTRHGKNRAGEPQPEGDLCCEPPDWMTEGQCATWRYAIDHAPRGVIKRIDRDLLATWVLAEDRQRRAAQLQALQDQTAQSPLLVTNSSGDLVPSPYLAIMNRAAMVLIKTGSELGFSPASRPRLATGASAAKKSEPESPWDRLQVIQGGKKAAG